jgi:pectate lyase
VAVPETSAEQAYEEVLAKVGVIFPARDALDERIINETRTGTAKYGPDGLGIIDSQNDLCPEKGKCSRCIKGDYCWLPELKSTPAPKDTDNDGMPDEWELKNRLNPLDRSDANKDRNNDGYTNIEEYINSLAGEI